MKPLAANDHCFSSVSSRTDAGYSGPIFYGPERIDVETRKKPFFFGACQLVPIAVRLVSDVQKKESLNFSGAVKNLSMCGEENNPNFNFNIVTESGVTRGLYYRAYLKKFGNFIHL